MQKNFDTITLKQDNGRDITFNGRLFSEATTFDEDTNELTKQRLYVTDDNDQIYSVIQAIGDKKTSRVIRFSVQDNMCIVKKGEQETALPLLMLTNVVRDLCNLDQEEIQVDAEEEERRVNHG